MMTRLFIATGRQTIQAVKEHAMYTIDIPASTPYKVHIGTMLLEASGELVRTA